MSAPPVTSKALVKEVLGTKSGLIGTCILIGLIIVATGVVVFYGYDVVNKWNDPFAWFENPRLAAPEWYQFFTTKRIPKTMILDKFLKSEYIAGDESLKYANLEATFFYNYDDFPSEVILIINGTFQESKPLVKVRLVRPDGRAVLLTTKILNNRNEAIFISSDEGIRSNIMDFLLQMDPTANTQKASVNLVLFAQAGPGMGDPRQAQVLKSDVSGTQAPYRLTVLATLHDIAETVDAKLIIYGKIYGLAGTDNRRRDLMIGVLWGAPIALAFGLISAIATTLIQTFLGALGAWYGGKSDELIQRMTDFYLVIPFLPVLITVSFIYRLTIWSVLAVLIVLSLLGGLTKSARSMVLQIKEELYIEAATSYGASKMRILTQYILPRIMSYAFANMVTSVPAYVFLEAALSLLGLGDPVVPTWGKIISEAYNAGAVYYGFWWWILIPSSLALMTAASFALLAYAFDKILNPKLREE